LIAPVLVPNEERSEYYIPVGRWTSFFHPERVVEGPTWIKEFVPIDEIPVWVRPGTMLCLGPEQTGKPDYQYNKDVHVHLYQLPDGQSLESDIPSGKGVAIGGRVRVTREFGKITVNTLDGDLEISSITVFNTDIIANGVDGGTLDKTKSPAICVDVEKGSRQVVIYVGGRDRTGLELYKTTTHTNM
jgi:alpha-glucosidase (family GH31 glycosyl hydrolase)